MWEHVGAALSISATLPIILTISIGTFAGIIIGALPGLGTVLGLVMAIPFTIAMDGPMAIALLLSIYVSSIYGDRLPQF